VSESNLTTAAYYQERDEASDVALAFEPMIAPPPVEPSTSGLARTISLVSRMVSFTLVVAITFVAVRYITAARDSLSARSKKSTHPIDWLLWFGGAKKDQTFEKYLRESAEKSQREWDEKYRESPAYQLRQQPVDWSNMQSKINVSPSFSTSSRRSP